MYRQGSYIQCACVWRFSNPFWPIRRTWQRNVQNSRPYVILGISTKCCPACVCVILSARCQIRLVSMALGKLCCVVSHVIVCNLFKNPSSLSPHTGRHFSAPRRHIRRRCYTGFRPCYIYHAAHRSAPIAICVLFYNNIQYSLKINI